MKIQRYFTKDLSSPYEGINFVPRVSKSFDSKEQSAVVSIIAPENWSQIAVDILAQKYRSKRANESDARDIFSRLCSTWAHFACESGLLDKQNSIIFKEECEYMLAHQIAAPNSPQWFNTGLFHSAGLSSTSAGHYYFDEKSQKVRELKNALERPQAHACFIQGVNDELVGPGSIMDLWQREARLFKYGSGSGSNFSALRGAGEKLASGGKSSGLMSWLKIGDTAAAAVKSGGTTRRAAKMVCLDADHPDVEDFINWKFKEEQKVSFLVTGQRSIRSLFFKILEGVSDAKIREHQELHDIDDVVVKRLRQMKKEGLSLKDFDQGNLMDFDWQGEAYRSISGQNANNSLRLNHDFFKKLEEGGQWSLINRTDSSVAKTIKAKDLFESICKAAWACADPGLQFSDSINEWHTCPKGGEIVASNPCSEYMFLDDTACNLASLNLVKFLEGKSFNIEKFKKAVSLWTIVLETSVGMASYPSEEIALKSYQYRTLGLGFANMGGLFMRLGLSYDSDEARSLARGVTSLMSAQAYLMSAQMAKVLKPFHFFEENREDFFRVLRNHEASLYKERKLEGVEFTPSFSHKEFSSSLALIKEAKSTWAKVLKDARDFGVRNAQVSAIAPTGTIALLMDCDTTGIEPDFSLIKYKSLAGGEVKKIVNHSVALALKVLGYSEIETRGIEQYILENNGVVKAPFLKESDYEVFDCAQSLQKPGRKLGLDAHLLMMAAAQPFVSGAISKTINLPEHSSIADVKKAFLMAYNLGLKSVSLYRDQSKLSQPMRLEEDAKKTIYSHLACLNCSKKMLIPAGTCMRCDHCGESTSCS